MRQVLLVAAIATITALIAVLLIPSLQRFLPEGAAPEQAVYLTVLLAFLIAFNTHAVRNRLGQSVGYLAIWGVLFGLLAFAFHIFGLGR